MKTIHTKKIIYTDTMKIFFFFHSKTEADQKKCINIPNNVPFYFLQLPSPLSFEREASLFVQINQYKNNKSYIMEQNGDPGFCGTRSSWGIILKPEDLFKASASPRSSQLAP